MTRSEEKTAREMAAQALTRATGVAPIPGNQVRLLRDAEENYPAWLQAIESATRWVHLETYIIHEDAVGRQFGELLAEKARQGVSVRLIYDWVGSINATSRSYYRKLEGAGVDVRCFNGLNIESPFAWLSRDHRKMLSVDGRVGYVSGLCIGQGWVGEPKRNRGPWRDTGVEIVGPALADLELAFADTWAATGDPLPSDELPLKDNMRDAGDITARIIATVPSSGSLYRVDHIITAMARRSIWLADAYFIGGGPYVQALQSAARSGLDVRLLIPGSNDVAIMRALSRSGLRPLLEAGVRVFEWNGSMMHAKTSVADGYWSRVGSTNLNIASWLGNRELDVIVEDEEFGHQMEESYENDLADSTEIVLHRTRRRTAPIPATPTPHRYRRSGGSSRAAAGILRIGNSLGAAVTNRRRLGPAEAVIMSWGAILLLGIAALAAYWPKVITVPIIVIFVWMAVSLLIKAVHVRFAEAKEKRRKARTGPPAASTPDRRVDKVAS